MLSLFRSARIALLIVAVSHGSAWANHRLARASNKPRRPAPPVVLDSGIREPDVERRPYRYYVARCAENLMKHATDRYGSTHQPLLVTTLDVRTREAPNAAPTEPGPWRIAPHRDRLTRLRGNDWLMDQSTLDVFYLLSKRLGDPKYAEFADSSIRAATAKACPKGFFWWGWHRHWDVDTDTMETTKANHHEIHVNRPRWERMWQLNPEATRRELGAIWQWHVVDKETGEHNRHGNGRRGRAFPMSGGEFIYALAWLSHKTDDPERMEQALLVADHHWQNRNADTNLVPGQSGTGRSRFDGQHCDTSIPGMLCYYLLKSYELTGEQAFRDQATAYLDAYARHGYDRATGKFFGSLRLDGTPEPGPRTTDQGYGNGEARGHVDLWEPYPLGYEHPICAAQAYAYAFQLTDDPRMLDVALKWAAWIRRAPPSDGCLVTDAGYAGYAKRFSRYGTYADKYGRTISLLLHLYALTGDDCHLDHARQTAREAVSRLYYRGLFRGHPAKAYYCSVDGVGFLLFALLQLDAVLDDPEKVVGQKSIRLPGGRGQIGFDNW